MENASKALIIAGSVLIAMIVLSVLVWGWNRVSSYYKAEEDAETVQQIYQKNKELESYNKQVIRGYELRSLYNLIDDMNTRYSEEQGYQPITAQLKLIEYDKNYPMNEYIDATKKINGNIELPKEGIKDESNNTTPKSDFSNFKGDKDTLCKFMKYVYDEYDKQGKKIFNESYFKCVDIKYNGELEGQDGKGTARVQSFKFEQIQRNN